jgi:hypothetical protein
MSLLVEIITIFIKCYRLNKERLIDGISFNSSYEVVLKDNEVHFRKKPDYCLL